MAVMHPLPASPFPSPKAVNTDDLDAGHVTLSHPHLSSRQVLIRRRAGWPDQAILQVNYCGGGADISPLFPVYFFLFIHIFLYNISSSLLFIFLLPRYNLGVNINVTWHPAVKSQMLYLFIYYYFIYFFFHFAVHHFCVCFPFHPFIFISLSPRLQHFNMVLIFM